MKQDLLPLSDQAEPAVTMPTLIKPHTDFLTEDDRTERACKAVADDFAKQVDRDIDGLFTLRRLHDEAGSYEWDIDPQQVVIDMTDAAAIPTTATGSHSGDDFVSKWCEYELTLVDIVQQETKRGPQRLAVYRVEVTS